MRATEGRASPAPTNFPTAPQSPFFLLRRLEVFNRASQSQFFLALVLAAAALLPSLCAPRAAAGEPEAAAKSDVRAVLEKAGDFEACDAYSNAHAVLREAYDAGSREAELVKSLAVIELKMGKASDASKRFDEALSQSAGNAELLLWSAVAASASGDDAKAAKTIAEGLSAAGNDEIALYDLAETFLRRSALSVAANLYQRVNDTLPTETQFDHFSYLHLAAYYGFTGRDGEAAALLEAKKKSFEYAEVEILVPAEVEYLIEYYKGRAAVAAGEAKKGADILRDAAAKFPDGIVADGEIVKALEAAGDTKEADGVYYLVSRRLKDRMASSPEKHQAYYNFALFVASSGRKDEDGLRACKMALALAPLRPEYLGVQAALLSALGRDEDALVPVQRAMVLVSAPRWVEPFQFDEFTWLRLEILRKLGRPLPKAFTTLPAPATAPPE